MQILGILPSQSNLLTIYFSSFFNFNFLLLFNYSCGPFLPIPPTSLPHFPPPPRFCPCVLYSSSCNPLSSLSPPHSPLTIVRLFLTSMSMVIFCCFFLLLIMFQLKGRSYGICPTPPGLFHLAKCSPVPSMRLQRV